MRTLSSASPYSSSGQKLPTLSQTCQVNKMLLCSHKCWDLVFCKHFQESHCGGHTSVILRLPKIIKLLYDLFSKETVSAITQVWILYKSHHWLYRCRKKYFGSLLAIFLPSNSVTLFWTYIILISTSTFSVIPKSSKQNDWKKSKSGPTHKWCYIFLGTVYKVCLLLKPLLLWLWC